MKQRLQAWGDTKILPIASCLVFNEAGELLLLQRHREDLGGGKWSFPGGRLEPGEDAETCARRETLEETDITLAEISLLGSHEVAMPHGAVHLTSFRAVVPDDIRIRLDHDEHESYRWFGINSLLHEKDLLFGIPSILRDFGLIENVGVDPTLTGGSKVTFLGKN